MSLLGIHRTMCRLPTWWGSLSFATVKRRLLGFILMLVYLKYEGYWGALNSFLHLLSEAGNSFQLWFRGNKATALSGDGLCYQMICLCPVSVNLAQKIINWISVNEFIKWFPIDEKALPKYVWLLDRRMFPRAEDWLECETLSGPLCFVHGFSLGWVRVRVSHAHIPWRSAWFLGPALVLPVQAVVGCPCPSSQLGPGQAWNVVPKLGGVSRLRGVVLVWLLGFLIVLS